MANEFENVDVSHAPPAATGGSSAAGQDYGGEADGGGSLWSSQIMYHNYVLVFAGILVFGNAGSLLANGGATAAFPQATLATFGGEGYVGYAVALGVVTVVMALTLGGLLFCEAAGRNVILYMAGFLLLWNGVGAGITTFGNPFLTVGSTPNGYFGIWASLLISAVMFFQTLRPELASNKKLQYNRQITKLLNRGSKLKLFVITSIAATIVWLVGAIECGRVGSCGSNNAYGIAFGVIQMVFMIGMIFLDRSMPGSAIIFYIMAANAAWWIASFLALTLNIGTIYATLSNGYFSFIVGTFSAVNLAATCRVAEDYQGEATDGNVEV